MTPDNHTKTSNAKISEALELLNEAAREKGEELKGLMTDKYAHLREAMAAGTGRAREVVKLTRDAAQYAVVEGREKIQEAASEADKRVRKNPWGYIAGAAGVALVLGYLMGSKRN